MNLGNFFNRLTTKRGDSEELKGCIKETVEKLIATDTDVKRPGVLLGKIQSGKTRAFLGVIALAFDNDYDIAIILTKGTKALAQQTYERLLIDFKEFEENDLVRIYDIMHVPEKLTPYELDQKIIMVVKKQTHNLQKIIKALMETYPDLGKKKVLIIDDEADFASIGFKKDKEKELIELNRIPTQIDELRSKVALSDFLQVTATPYSLYLQPENINMDGEVFKPIRPAFTVILPTYRGYIGGDFYFSEDEENVLAKSVYEEVPAEEIKVLKKEDKRSFKLEEVLTSDKITFLRKAVLNFVVGASIRRLQQRAAGLLEKKYSFIIHTEQSKSAHSWQENIVVSLKESLEKSLQEDEGLFRKLIEEVYQGLSCSLVLVSGNVPSFNDVFLEVSTALKKGHLMITKVNSEKEVSDLLDSRGQLKLRTPLNIFIGGQMLDRGITIDNLIGFYYGRQPNKFQQDTVLQHSRMFGNRELGDLAVTRFYTSVEIFEAMRRINEFDNALREAFEKGAHEQGVVFICKDVENKILPCSPNKVMLSTITTIKPGKRMLPVGFQTHYKTPIQNTLKKIDDIITKLFEGNNPDEPLLVDINLVERIIEDISEMLIFDEGYDWDVSAFKLSMEYLSKNSTDTANKGRVWCFVRKDRNISRKRDGADGRFSNVPDSEDIAADAKDLAEDLPVLVLLRQNGKEEDGWRGSPFWWPVLFAPQNIRTVIFASDTEDSV